MANMNGTDEDLNRMSCHPEKETMAGSFQCTTYDLPPLSFNVEQGCIPLSIY